MNSLFLVAAMVVTFVFGYRFYAKLLALDVFRLDKNYSTPAQTRADAREYVPTHPHLLFGHHLAAVTGAATFAAPVVALAWGWVPAFLWITVGSAVAAGTYGLGTFWLCARQAGGLGTLAQTLIGPLARLVLLVLLVPVLLTIIATSAGLGASLLAAYPNAVLPLLAATLIALLLGTYLHGRAATELLPAAIIAFALSLFLVWLLGGAPLALSGALTIALGKYAAISIDAVVVWVVLLLVYAFHAARLPVWQLMRPRAFLTSLLLAVMLLLFYAASAVTHPVLDAPEFHTVPDTSGALPWLFLIVGAGALAGWQFFIIHGVTARELRHETDARYVGYGAALVQGLIALSALLLAATAFAGRDEWLAHYTAAPSASDFPRALTFYVNECARHIAALGLDADFARTLTATVLAGLSLAVLEASTRALKNFFIEVAPLPPASGRRDPERSRLWLVVVAGGVVALHDGRGYGGLAAWPLLALISLWLAAIGFALIALALRARQRPVLLIAGLAAVIAALAAWSSVAQLWLWWETRAWGWIGAGVALLLLLAALIHEIVTAARRAVHAVPADAPAKLDT